MALSHLLLAALPCFNQLTPEFFDRLASSSPPARNPSSDIYQRWQWRNHHGFPGRGPSVPVTVPPTFRPAPVHACHRAGRRRSRQNVKSRGEAAMIACTEKGSAVRLFPTRHGREIAARPGGHTTAAHWARHRHRLRAGNRGRARSGWPAGVWAINHALPPPTAHMRSPGSRGYSARQAGRQLFGGDHHVALASSTSTCPLLPCCTDHCGFGRKRKGGHFGAGSETTQVHCRQGPLGPSSTTYVRTCVQAVMPRG